MIVVIGSGISALTVVCSLLRKKRSNQSILILEKAEQVGGNSILATSGLSLLNPLNQNDNLDKFVCDINGTPNRTDRTDRTDRTSRRIKDICESSQYVIPFLNQIGIHLPNVIKSGSHSAERTYYNKRIKVNIGRYIINKMLGFVKRHPNIHIRTNEPVISIKKVGASWLVESARTMYEASHIVIATGGFGYNRAMLNRAMQSLPTTNKDTITGDGIKMAAKVGGRFVSKSAVQIHPTGFITNEVKNGTLRTKPPRRIWLCPEIYRSCGAILTNLNGHRFVDELASRRTISHKIMELPHRVAMIKFPASIDTMNITKTYLKMKHIIKSSLPDKHMYPYIAYITPCIHYTMGGIEVDQKYHIIKSDTGRPIHNLYACGEVAAIFKKERPCGLGLTSAIVSGLKVAASIMQVNRL